MRQVLVVEFDVDPARIKEFVAAAKDNARNSLAEPGCERFDVLLSKEGDAKVGFYEVYGDEAAVEAHRRSAHYAAFVKAREGAMRGVRVSKWTIAP